MEQSGLTWRGQPLFWLLPTSPDTLPMFSKINLYQKRCCFFRSTMWPRNWTLAFNLTFKSCSTCAQSVVDPLWKNESLNHSEHGIAHHFLCSRDCARIRDISWYKIWPHFGSAYWRPRHYVWRVSAVQKRRSFLMNYKAIPHGYH